MARKGTTRGPVELETELAQMWMESRLQPEISGPGSSEGVLQIKNAVAEDLGAGSSEIFHDAPFLSRIAYRVQQYRYSDRTTPMKGVSRPAFQALLWFLGPGGLAETRENLEKQKGRGIGALYSALEEYARRTEYLEPGKPSGYLEELVAKRREQIRGEATLLQDHYRKVREAGITPHPLWWSPVGDGFYDNKGRLSA